MKLALILAALALLAACEATGTSPSAATPNTGNGTELGNSGIRVSGSLEAGATSNNH